MTIGRAGGRQGSKRSATKLTKGAALDVSSCFIWQNFLGAGEPD
jgi:hypothetical protein